MQLPSEEHQEAIATEVVDGAYTVHKTVGPGMLESTYHGCFRHELKLRGLRVRSNVPQPVYYRGIKLSVAYRIDLLVEDCIIVELKAVQALLPVHHAQLLTYLRLSNLRIGFLINFHAPMLKDGVRRIVNG